MVSKLPKTTIANAIWIAATYAFAKGYVGQDEMVLIGGVMGMLGLAINRDKFVTPRK